MNHLIIGAGPAGVIAAEALRSIDPHASVTIVGDEPEPPYSRMALPYFLVKKVPEHGTYLRKSANHFDRHRIELKIGRVTGVDPERHQATIESGESLNYDKLLIATGSHPVSPPIPGIDRPGVVPCWTLADARTIAGRARQGAKVVLMGAGFIGCIILEALAKSGASLTVVEMEDRMVPRMMNERAGNLIKRWCQDKGVEVHTSTRIQAIEQGEAHPLRVVTDSGNIMEADLVVSATGVRPNIEFLAGSGINTDQGILIDRHMQASRPDVFAAGDVAQGLDFSTGDCSVQAIQPTAADHGQIAARNMAGSSQALHRGSINMNVLDTLGLISSSFGLWMGRDGGDSAHLFDPRRFRYIDLQFQDDILIGATSLGLTQHVGVLRGLIQSKIQLGKWKKRLMDDPTRIMEAYLASTQPIGANAAILK